MIKAKGSGGYRELYRLVTLAQNSVAADGDNTVPPTASRQLRRYQSNAAEETENCKPDTERNDTFAAVQK